MNSRIKPLIPYRERKTLSYTREQLRRLLERSRGDPGQGDDGGDPGDPRHGLPAAVLIGLVNRPDGPTILLTKRTEHLRDHAGQICFPGGRIEAADASIEAAALREAEEEIGLPPSQVDVISRLDAYDTSTGFRVHPVVGWIEPPLTFRLDEVEVAEVFELPLAFALDPHNHQQQFHQRGKERRSYYVLPYEGRFIWGATAGMLVVFAKLLAP
jgi:8-oxo-dGTP pyrophosphatase MutT (NUDIX family)